jgi:hypothetical protein
MVKWKELDGNYPGVLMAYFCVKGPTKMTKRIEFVIVVTVYDIRSRYLPNSPIGLTCLLIFGLGIGLIRIMILKLAIKMRIWHVTSADSQIRTQKIRATT